MPRVTLKDCNIKPEFEQTIFKGLRCKLDPPPMSRAYKLYVGGRVELRSIFSDPLVQIGSTLSALAPRRLAYAALEHGVRPAISRTKTSISREWKRDASIKESTGRTLLLILAVAFIFRALAAIFFTGPIDMEGAEYARIAENLLWGNGYVGIAEGDGPQLFFPPLFPFTIAAVSLLTGDTEIAGRIISVAMGALIVVPTYFLANKMYGRRPALLAATLVGFHPYLIYMSTTVFSEMTFITLALAALYLAIAATDDASYRNLLLCGLIYGLAYLVRPEAAYYMLIAAILIALSMVIKRQYAVLSISARIGLMIAAFAFVASPYIVWLSAETGKFRIEGKSPLNLAIGIRKQQGENPNEVMFGVDSAGNERGVWNQPNLVSIQAFSISFREFATYIRQQTKTVIKNASAALASTLSYGEPPLFAFAILGLLARPWSRSLAGYHLHIFAVLGLVLIANYFVFTLQNNRYFVLLVPFYCVWAAVGLQRFVSWGTATGFSIGLPDRFRHALRAFLWALGLGLVFAPAMSASAAQLAAVRNERPVKLAGEWLRTLSNGPIHILDSSAIISFHAKASLFWLPCCDEKAALRYIDKSAIDFIIVRESSIDSYPYLKKWVDYGITDHRWELIRSIEGRQTAGDGWEKIAIYRVKRDWIGSRE